MPVTRHPLTSYAYMEQIPYIIHPSPLIRYKAFQNNPFRGMELEEAKHMEAEILGHLQESIVPHHHNTILGRCSLESFHKYFEQCMDKKFVKSGISFDEGDNFKLKPYYYYNFEYPNFPSLSDDEFDWIVREPSFTDEVVTERCVLKTMFVFYDIREQNYGVELSYFHQQKQHVQVMDVNTGTVDYVAMWVNLD